MVTIGSVDLAALVTGVGAYTSYRLHGFSL
jgi:hypothetical protein